MSVPTAEALPLDGDHLGRARTDLAAGRMILPIDSRSDTGHLVLCAEYATTAVLAFLIRPGSGLIEVALGDADRTGLCLPAMWNLPGANSFAGDYTVTVDVVEGVGTGISAADRARTVRALADPRSEPADFTRPRHVSPVRAHGAGTVCTLLRLAEVRPIGVVTALVSLADSSTMAGAAECREFAVDHGLAVVDRGPD
ncbi:3,4-dihydroxy-2-butanone-4-phosphate synthase [Nocardia sp. alder85J]|uniref:3,4-dihydroxy-2-butanone-4-phosphate synthase n=1 Tax=Nocardia sp. alder85J TaxID=2862949 RepID=UPI001CD37234|nr:3,4-dihydroxy-2-butanone-4-phosphate synthase [Nocardia sp. alder85J]MCX4098594.1 3,4-dihydroxy-2-butanone-4-phosphate synthase [Nocardia sp. alder85J]